ncbi:Protein of unknown function, partial [Cotesia congregata]
PRLVFFRVSRVLESIFCIVYIITVFQQAPTEGLKKSYQGPNTEGPRIKDLGPRIKESGNSRNQPRTRRQLTIKGFEDTQGNSRTGPAIGSRGHKEDLWIKRINHGAKFNAPKLKIPNNIN